jgi:hypothetical protein
LATIGMSTPPVVAVIVPSATYPVIIIAPSALQVAGCQVFFSD